MDLPPLGSSRVIDALVQRAEGELGLIHDLVLPAAVCSMEIVAHEVYRPLDCISCLQYLCKYKLSQAKATQSKKVTFLSLASENLQLS